MSPKSSFTCTVILLLLFRIVSANGQQQGPRFFHYHEISGHLKELRKGALEYVVVEGDNSPEGDQRIIDTLQMLLGEKTPPGSSGLWSNYRKVIKNLQIRKANWQNMPMELSRFQRLFELTFMECPHVTLQGINDQMKQRRDADVHDDLYKKFKNDIVSLSFYDTDFDTQDSCNLEVKLMEELRELRFVRIGNFQQHCETLLTEINRAYPSLGWLTIESCSLDNTQSLLPLQSFKKLKSLSIPRNYLTQIPKVSESLIALDVSFNFLSELPAKSDSVCLEVVDFIYLDCNLFDYFNLYKILSDNILDRIEVLSYDPCNFENPNELSLISHAFDKRKVAVYMPFVERYTNDFAPAVPDCERCKPHRDAFIRKMLQNVSFVDSVGGQSQISFEPGNSKMQMWSVQTSSVAPASSVFLYRQLKSCTRNCVDDADANLVWDWQFCFLVEEPNDIQNQLKKLVLNIKGNTGTVKWGNAESR